MASYYWLEMARGAKRTAQELTKKYNSYNEYCNTLYSLIEKIEGTISIMESTERDYANGGFVANDETLDRGTLKSNCNVLGKDSDVVNSVLRKTINDMTEMREKINSANNNYNTYMSNYYYELELESQAES